MSTQHEIVELSVFLILLGLALPLLRLFHDVNPTAGIVASVILILPAPAWFARLCVAIPKRLEMAIVWHSMCAWIIVLIVFGIGAIFALYQWCLAM